MQIELTHPFGTHILQRYPRGAQHKSLQAWDATDEYLLRTLADNYSEHLPTSHIAILNDDFGALTCALQPYHITHWNDSLIAQQAARANLASNELEDTVNWCHSLEAPSRPVDIALIKIPKNLTFLADQLQRLRPLLHDKSIVLAGSKMQKVTKSVQDLFEQHIGPNRTGLAWKKSRLLLAEVSAPELTYSTAMCHWEVPEYNLKIANMPNVFARNQLDIGARFMLENLTPVTGQRIIDLGCGNGVLGCAALHLNPEACVTFVDESYHAVASAKQNVTTNHPDALPNCEFWHNNCLSYYGLREPADLILCNPPFHQNNTITEHIAIQMFHDSYFALKPGGELRIVANRHLTYGKVLKKRFGGFTVTANSDKFTILSTFKKG
jgi:16S rRNA G1207 methylase RsmC